MFLSKESSLDWAHPLVQEWFLTKIGVPTEPQLEGWPSIHAGQSTLISAPTGSGKTFSAFLICINKLVEEAISGQLPDLTQVVYVSPLKALSNDIKKNLAEPLSDISALAFRHNIKMADIRIAIRTGDTEAYERQKMIKNPPHILVTTPESLYILLTAEKSRKILTDVKTVIIDEIHAIVSDKRGAHLSLSLERLEALTKIPPQRIGLSATQKPLETVAEYLTGNGRVKPVIVNVGYDKPLELSVLVPKQKLGAIATNEMWDELYDKIAALTNEHRSMLIFVNTRRLAERIAHHLRERLGENHVAAHHGSLSRSIRFDVENRLKNGELKALVATASLELGIDIGMIDLVCQIGSSRAIATLLQRVGRSGHVRHAISKGHIFATTRDELLECSALVEAIHAKELDTLIIPKEPLDILAQQIVAMCATHDWTEDHLFQVVKKAYPYRNLKLETFSDILQVLSDGVTGSRNRYGAFIFRDRVNRMLSGKRNARLVSIMNGGAIPENGLYTVLAEPDETIVGTLDEDFAIESNRGDIILLGTTSWKIQRIESASGIIRVEDAKGAPPSVPFWRGEAPARTDELSLRVSKLRQTLGDLLSDENCKSHAVSWLCDKCKLDSFGAEQLVDYILEGRKVLGAIPTQQCIIAERFFDESGGMQLVIHAPFGARINKAWGFALRKRFCRSFNFELQAAATDDGLNISLSEQHSFPLMDIFQFLHTKTVKEVLVQAILQSPLFHTRFRWNATRFLALLRFRYGKKTPPNIQRMLAEDLLAEVFPDVAACQDNLSGHDIVLPDHPIINETMKDILNHALDLDGLLHVIQYIEAGNIHCHAIDTPTPSVFSNEILNANPYAFLDDAPLEERRARAVDMRRVLPDSVLNNIGKLDPKAIVEIKENSWPDVRNADELHDALQTLIAYPENYVRYNRHWNIFFNELQNKNRATRAVYQDQIFWVVAEKVKTFSMIYPDSIFEHKLLEIETEVSSQEITILTMLRGWLSHLGPTSAYELSEVLKLPQTEIEQHLVKLETTGFVLRGQFTTVEHLEWCERRLLARIHQLTINALRKQIEPVSPSQFMRWLLDWQHVTHKTQLAGEQGLLEVIKQLQGFELSAKIWEKEIFPLRVRDYQQSMLDHLCLTGIVCWGRFSQYMADKEDITIKRIKPSRSSPITFFIRGEMPYKTMSQDHHLKHLSFIANNIYQFLSIYGAAFFLDIVQGTKHLKAEVEMGLWELVTVGLITADSFDNLRIIINPRRNKSRRGRKMITSYSGGRWSLLKSFKNESPSCETICWILLRRYGIIFRDLLVREKLIPPWREIVLVLRQLEERGEIRSGRFIQGFIGEQFALPNAIESLRLSRNITDSSQKITLSAVDPLNLIGIILPGQKIPALSTKHCELTAS